MYLWIVCFMDGKFCSHSLSVGNNEASTVISIYRIQRITRNMNIPEGQRKKKKQTQLLI